MPKIAHYALHAVELPFKGAFEHAALKRETSSSLFLELRLDDGSVGWGESLPRVYVTGETQAESAKLLVEKVLPKLQGMSFGSMEELVAFLKKADGLAPGEWAAPEVPQSAAWCCVDLALLDAFGRSFGKKPFGEIPVPESLRYSGVLSSKLGWKQKAQLLTYRVLGFPAVKLKIDETSDANTLAAVRRYAGSKIELRGDVNMGWSLAQAHERMPLLARHGVTSFEQPLAADDLEGAAELVRTTGLDVMADESLNTRDSLNKLIEMQACTAINARVSKCGGLVATRARCDEADAAGMWIQIGCQVGESSLLSAAHVLLCSAFGKMRHAEGCFATHLLQEDPASPILQFKAGGRPPSLPDAPGLGVRIDAEMIARRRTGHWTSRNHER